MLGQRRFHEFADHERSPVSLHDGGSHRLNPPGQRMMILYALLDPPQ
jgi:hypothetical protein